MSEEHPVTLDLLGELMMNLQADLQVVSATMLRLDRSMDPLREEVRGVRDEMHEIRLELRAMHDELKQLADDHLESILAILVKGS